MKSVRRYFCILGSKVFILKIFLKQCIYYFRNNVTACSVTFSMSFYAYISVDVYISIIYRSR